MADRRWGLLAGTVLAVALVGCSSGLAPGPLARNDGAGQECADTRPGQVIADGITGLINDSGHRLVLDHVNLASPRGLKVVASWEVPGPTASSTASPRDIRPTRT